jgi:solute carrier family 25 phosphate transporter 3
VSHPADTLVSYLNKAPGAGIGAAVKELGFAGLWAGLGPRIIMIGTLTALQWFIYDGVKVGRDRQTVGDPSTPQVQLGLPRPPPPEMPESLKKKMAAAQS